MHLQTLAITINQSLIGHDRYYEVGFGAGTPQQNRVCEATNAPVGISSNRTVLRSKMEGPCPDKFTLTRLDFCGNLSQQLNITHLLRVPARLPKEPEQVFNFLIATSRTRTKAIPEGMVRFRLLCGDFLLQNQQRTLKTA